MKTVNLKDESGYIVPADVIRYDVPLITGTLKRLTEGGLLTCKIKTNHVYVRELSAEQEYTFTISEDVLILPDYFKTTSNKFGITIVDVTCEGFDMAITIKSETDLNNIWFELQYSVPGEDYHKVEITIPSSSTNPVAFIPKVKFNKKAPVMWSTDDGYMSDFILGFNTLNGYPTRTSKDSSNHGIELLKYLTSGETVSNYSTYEYDDGTGIKRRYGFELAVMNPQDFVLDQNDHGNSMVGPDFDVMRCFGVAIAVHDFNYFGSEDTIIGPGLPFSTKSEYEKALISAYRTVSERLKTAGKFGIKVSIEPAGAKVVMSRCKRSDAIALLVAQDKGSGPYDNSFYGQESFESFDKNINYWCNGESDPSSLLYKPQTVLTRHFDTNGQGSDDVINKVKDSIDNGKNTICIYGTHGRVQSIVDLIDYCKTRNDVWVCSIDEWLEYCHIYNHAKIKSCTGDGSNVKIEIWIPLMEFHQFCEFTLNVNITDGGKATVSNNVYGMSCKQNSDQYTININLEDSLLKNATMFVNAYRTTGNEFFKRDAKYLVNLLKDGDVKTEYLSILG